MGYASVVGFVIASMAIITCVICASGLVAKAFGQYAGFGTFVVLLLLALYFIYRLGKLVVLSYIRTKCSNAAGG
ncbi:MAG: hypothetical protein GXO32_06260 [Crenarchaeota archaeon]|nr:hypothetical protein [Thermoproteota archaeon]